jgi:hypothetical protein
MTPEQVYDMTLPEITAYLEGWQAKRRERAMYLGTIAAAVYNASPGKKRRKPLKWDDIFHIKNSRSADASEKWEELKRIFPPTTHKS